MGAILVPCLKAPKERERRPLPSGQAAQGKGVDTQLKLPHFEFRNCGERVSSVGSWGKKERRLRLAHQDKRTPWRPSGHMVTGRGRY